MGTLTVVVEKKFFHDIAKLFQGGDNQVVEAFALKRLDEGLNVAVGFRATRRDALGLAADVREVVGEPCLEERVAIVDEVAEVEEWPRFGCGRLAPSTGHPD